MNRVTFRDLAEKQHGPSKATRNFSAERFGGWHSQKLCTTCGGVLTEADRDAGECTVCGAKEKK